MTQLAQKLPSISVINGRVTKKKRGLLSRERIEHYALVFIAIALLISIVMMIQYNLRTVSSGETERIYRNVGAQLQRSFNGR